MEEVTDVGWGEVMASLVHHRQVLEAYTVLYGEPGELMEDRGDMALFVSMGR